MKSLFPIYILCGPAGSDSPVEAARTEQKVRPKQKKENSVSAILLQDYRIFIRITALFSDDCALWASVSAGAAVNAYVRINFVDVAFGNSSDRAFVETSTASYAVLCDFVSHKFMSLK